MQGSSRMPRGGARFTMHSDGPLRPVRPGTGATPSFPSADRNFENFIQVSFKYFSFFLLISYIVFFCYSAIHLKSWTLTLGLMVIKEFYIFVQELIMNVTGMGVAGGGMGGATGGVRAGPGGNSLSFHFLPVIFLLLFKLFKQYNY